MTAAPRRQYSYSVAQSSEYTDYVPGRTRNAEREAMFAGHEGIVIPWQQKVGAVAMARSFDIIMDESSDADIEQIAGVFATVSLGSAFHSFAQRPQHRVMRRHGRLPDILDRETKQPIGYDGLLKKVSSGLWVAAESASKIEAMVRVKASPKAINQKNYGIGRVMFNNAMDLASVEQDVTGMVEGNEFELQEAAWDAAHEAVQKAIDLTDELGVRPTVGLLIDPTNDYTIYLHDDTKVLSKDNFEVLNSQLRKAADEFTVAA